MKFVASSFKPIARLFLIANALLVLSLFYYGFTSLFGPDILQKLYGAQYLFLPLIFIFPALIEIIKSKIFLTHYLPLLTIWALLYIISYLLVNRERYRTSIILSLMLAASLSGFTGHSVKSLHIQEQDEMAMMTNGPQTGSGFLVFSASAFPPGWKEEFHQYKARGYSARFICENLAWYASPQITINEYLTDNDDLKSFDAHSYGRVFDYAGYKGWIISTEDQDPEKVSYDLEWRDDGKILK